MPKRKKKLADRVAPTATTGQPRYESGRGSMRAFWIFAGLLMLALWGVYSRALDAPFIFDDRASIVRNHSIESLWPLVGDADNPGPLNPPHYIPTSARPLVNLSLALNYAIGTLEPVGYRIVNLALHFFSTMLLWSIVRRTLQSPRFGRDQWPATLLASAVAYLWALHPLQTETVVYATQRTELMMALFYLATLYCSLRYWSSRAKPDRAIWLTLSVLACSAGMFSKEVMVSAPLMVLLFDRAFVAGSLGKAVRGSWPLYTLLFCTWAILFVLHLDNPHGDVAGFQSDVSLFTWWTTQAKVVLLYLRLAFWPWPLQIHYEISQLTTFAEAWPYLLTVAILALTTLYLLWRNHPVGYLATWIFVILSPTSLVPIITEAAAERRMYLSLAGLTALVVAGTYALTELHRTHRGRGARATSGKPLFAFGASIVLVGTALTCISAARVAVYQEPIELWLDVARRQPHSYVAQQNLGAELLRAGRLQDAVRQFRRAIELNPKNAEPHYSLGLIYRKTNRIDDAISEFREAARIEPDVDEHHNNLGATLFEANRIEESLPHFHKAIEVNPEAWLAHDNLGRALAAAGRFPEAITHYQRALQINPQALNIYGHLADAYARSNRPGDAITAAEQALELARSRGEHQVAKTIASQLASFRAAQARGRESRATDAAASPPPN